MNRRSEPQPKHASSVRGKASLVVSSNEIIDDVLRKMDAANAAYSVILDEAGNFRALVSRTQVLQAIPVASLQPAAARTIGRVFSGEPRPIVVEADTPLHQIAREYAKELRQFPHVGIILISEGGLPRIIPRDTILDLQAQYGIQRSERGTPEKSDASSEMWKESASRSSAALPDPLARYTNVRIFESRNIVRESEIRDGPLVAGRQYTLDVSIGLSPAGVPQRRRKSARTCLLSLRICGVANRPAFKHAFSLDPEEDHHDSRP
jgi:hypothetical protein